MTLASPLRLPLLGALLGFHLVVAAAPAAPAAVSFDTTPRAGQHQRQTIDMQMLMTMRAEAAPEASEEQRAKIAQAAAQMAQAGPVKVSTRMRQTMKVGAADDAGWLPMTVSVAHQGGSVEVGGKATPLPQAQAADVSFSARFNPKDFGFELGRFDAGSPEVNALMATQGQAMIGEALQLYKALAQRPLKVGESVELPMTMALPMPLPGGAGAMQGRLRYTLARVAKGVAHFDLDMDLKMDISAPLPQPAQAASAASAADTDAADTPPQMLRMVATGSGKGTSSLRLSDRLPLANRLAMRMQMAMNGPDNGRMAFDMDMVMQSKGESLARPVSRKKP